MQIEPCLKTIDHFHEVVFGECRGVIALRSYRESSDHDTSKAPMLEWIDNDAKAVERIYSFAKSANNRHMACYCIPGIVASRGKAGSTDVTAMQTLLADIDDGNTEEKLASAIQYLGEPALIVESGGVTEIGASKLHVYWKLPQPASGDALAKLIEARHQLAIKIGGDEHFKSKHQPIRIAGSIYHKTQPAKLVAIRGCL